MNFKVFVLLIASSLVLCIASPPPLKQVETASVGKKFIHLNPFETLLSLKITTAIISSTEQAPIEPYACVNNIHCKIECQNRGFRGGSCAGNICLCRQI